MLLAVTVLALQAAAAAGAVQDVGGSRVELVRLDVIVTDRDGRPVRDLTREDFVVLEDGQPQVLSHFAPALPAPRTPTPVAPPDPGAAPTPAPPEPAPSGPPRTIMIVVDDIHIATGNIEFAKQGLRRLLDEFVPAEDQVALVTTSTGLLVAPTTDRAGLRRAIGGLKARAMVVMPAARSEMTPAQAEMVVAGDRRALELAAQTILSQPSSVPGGQNVSPETRLRFAEAQAQRQARRILAEALRFSTATMSTLADVLASLAPLPGRKLCLLVSDGFLLGNGTSEDRRNDLRRVVDASMRGAGVVYALDSRGLTTGISDAGMAAVDVPPGLLSEIVSRGDQLQRSTLNTLAEDTGGFLVRGTNDLAGGLRRMLDDNDSYYLLAYEPSNTRRDGRFRRIEVRLRRPGLTARTRKGYLAPDDRKTAPTRAAAAPSAGPDDNPTGRTLDEAEARALLTEPAGSGLAVRLTADWFAIPPAGTQVVVRAHVDLSRVLWQEVEGRSRAVIEIVGGVYDAAGKPVGSAFGKRAAFDLGRGELERVVRSGLHYQELLPLAPGRYEVRLRAQERAAALAGSAAQSVEVPDLAGGTLALSSLFLSSSAPAVGENGSTGEETLRDAHTLRRFRAGQSLYFQVYVYNPKRDERRTDVVLQAQLRSGGALVAASKPQPASLQQKDGVPLPETNGMPLAGLAPGSYELRVVVVDRKANATASRSVDFTLE
jgi:VWFA-related protein